MSEPLVFDADDIDTPADTRSDAETGTPERHAAPSAHDELICFGHLYGSSPAMLQLYGQVEKVAGTDVSVLICGESGTGKELLAHTLHEKSLRTDQPFIPVNCGAISGQLIESELFGHEKGSFTGAHQRHIGYFEHASGGTVFLDEVTEMPAEMQVKLLRVLETGCFYRVGGTEQIEVNVRIIAATNRPLDEAVRSGHFREDLMYRLAVVPMHLPPLRARGDDVEKLARHFLDELNTAHAAEKTLSRNVPDTLRLHPWPGNVRELKNAIQRAFILGENELDIDIPTRIVRVDDVPVREGCLNIAVGVRLADVQRAMILATLEQCEGDKRRAARTLGVSLKTLYNRLALYQSNADASALV